MEEKMKTLIIDYAEGNLTGELHSFVAKNIDTKEEWAKEHEQVKAVLEAMDQDVELIPNDSMKSEFEAMLREEMEMATANDPKTVIWGGQKRWMQVAAAVTILVVGVLVGKVVTDNTRNNELQALRKEMQATKELVIASLQNQSASSRLSAVNVSYTMNSLDDEMINVLIKTMNADPNTNVRLAALEALSRFADKQSVRAALIKSLSIQDKPIVQIALINLMVQLKEEKAIEPLKQIMEDENTLDVVKEEANFGVFKLS